MVVGEASGGVDPVAATSMEYIGVEIDDQLGYLRRVRLEIILLGPIGPIGEIHHHGLRPTIPLFVDGFHDIETLAVEEIGVITEQAFKLGHHRMSCWNGLGLELAQSLVDLCGIHLHAQLLRFGFRCDGHPGPAITKGENARGGCTVMKGNSLHCQGNVLMSAAFAYCRRWQKSGSVMALGFPNESRFYDGAVHAVRFSGHDGALEVPFFIGEHALKQIQPDMPVDESGLLAAFDLNRERIYATATKVYERGRKGSYDVLPEDF